MKAAAEPVSMAQDAPGAAAGLRLSPKIDEAGLIRAVQRGDQDAFEQLVRAYDQKCASARHGEPCCVLQEDCT